MSPIPDLVELTRRSMEATNRREFNVAATMFAEDAEFDVSSVGLGCLLGAPAMHGYLEDWLGAYETQEFREWEGHDLGNGVVFVVSHLDARPIGSQAMVQEQWAFTVLWRSGAIQRVVASPHVEEARGEAERLAKLGE